MPVTVQGTGRVTGSVTVTNSTSNPVPVTGTVTTQIAGGGAATAAGQPVSKIVDLDCSRSPNVNVPVRCVVAGQDPTSAAAFTVPSGLVITDVQWEVQSTLANPQNQYDRIFLEQVVSGVNQMQLAVFHSLCDASGTFAGQSHLTTGVALPSGSSLRVAEGTSSIVQG